MPWPWSASSTPRAGQNPVLYPRAHERTPSPGLRCVLGEIADISPGGMRVRSGAKPKVRAGEEIDLAVRSESQKMSVRGRVAWAKRVSWRSFELGIRFLGVDEARARALLSLAKYGFVAPESDAAPSCPPSSHAGPRPGPKFLPPTPCTVEVEDLYGILGVARFAGRDEITSAYRALARRLHPDVNTEPGASEQFTLVSKAYSVLRDDEKRQRYDSLLMRCA